MYIYSVIPRDTSMYLYLKGQHLKPQNCQQQTDGAIVQIELCLFDVLVYAQISYVRAAQPPRPAQAGDQVACANPEARKTSAGKVEQCPNNMLGRTRMRKPFHYQSNWLAHARRRTLRGAQS